jgi:spore coat protein U-like protein
MSKSSVAAAVAIGLLASAVVPAATRTTTMGVAGSLVDTCLISASALSFPPYVAGSGAVVGTSTISLRCSNGAIYAVGLSAGSTPGTTMAQRLLSNGTHTLQYNLYTSNSYTTVWGDGTGGSAVIAGFSSGFASPISLTIYGQLPDNTSNRLATSGTYSDTILIVLDY